jgi:predicted PurR-regulated permease PerM
VSFGIICVLVIVFLFTKISFLLTPLLTIANVLLIPFMVAGFFYYLMRPLVRYLVQRNVHRIVSILILYVILAGITILFFHVVWPPLQKQTISIIENTPQLVAGLQTQLGDLSKNSVLSPFLANQSEWTAKLSQYVDQSLSAVTSYVSQIFSFLTSFIIIVSTFPFILYYLLKEGEKVPIALQKMIPRRYLKDGDMIIKEIDRALSGFIIGRVMIASILGVMFFVGFLIVGLPYALLLSVISFVLNMIPYIGPILGAIPCIIVGFTISPSMALWVFIVVMAAQQIEGSFLSPHIYGRALEIHPLTTILLLLVAGDLAGILGVILAIPVYMIIKILVKHSYQMFLEDKVEDFVK